MRIAAPDCRHNEDDLGGVYLGGALKVAELITVRCTLPVPPASVIAAPDCRHNEDDLGGVYLGGALKVAELITVAPCGSV
jgi:hypothetical protein